MEQQTTLIPLERWQIEHDQCTECACFRELIWKFSDSVMGLLYPQHSPAKAQTLDYLRDAFLLLRNALSAQGHDDKAIENHIADFFDSLEKIKSQTEADADSILSHDPAAESLVEVKLAYPGFYATAIYRLAHQLLNQGVSLIPRLMTEYAHRQTGIDIHPGAKIASPFVIDHGTGIVIGQTAEIGTGVVMYQGVTLGAIAVTKSMAKNKRHPTIENDVLLYAGATILGGDTVVGARSIIGGNVWLTESVPADSFVTHQPEIRVKPRK